MNDFIIKQVLSTIPRNHDESNIAYYKRLQSIAQELIKSDETPKPKMISETLSPDEVRL